MNKFGIPQHYWDNIILILAPFREKNQKIIIFGSRARGDYQKFSDIDMCFYPLSGRMSRRSRALIATIWEDVSIPYNVDVVFWDELTNQQLRQNIEKEGVQINFE